MAKSTSEFIKIPLLFISFVFLTVVTQIGGLVFLVCLPICTYLRSKIKNKILGVLSQIFVALLFYIVCTLCIVPPLARLGGRVPLPIYGTVLQPRNIGFCLLNRHYVKPQLKTLAIKVAQQLQQQYPGTVLLYLDAGFPFVDGFPLIPHLSHNDGKKLDLAFFYRSQLTQKASNTTPSFIGYGICEEPLPTEQDYAAQCAQKGYWQYSWLQKVISQSNKKLFVVDEPRTKTMIQVFSEQTLIEKLFLEPHLKKRWQLDTYPKIRLHGCRAVRHDDHLHVQIK